MEEVSTANIPPYTRDRLSNFPQFNEILVWMGIEVTWCLTERRDFFHPVYNTGAE
jgi:hypothetical protein